MDVVAELQAPVMSASDPKANRLIGMLSPAEFERWSPLLERVAMPLGQVLYESGSTPKHVYFPTTAMVSLLYSMSSGASAEVAVIGNEGFVGVFLLTSGGVAACPAVVQSSGEGFRLDASVIKDELGRAGPAMQLLLRYSQSLITQLSQTAVCNRHHSVEQQLCRRLLSSLDRQTGIELATTQEQMASLLGVRREGVTEAAIKLQTAGLIRYTRGRIRVLDREGLQQRACECYEVVKKEYDRLLPTRSATAPSG